jgi:hypothetical protein
MILSDTKKYTKKLNHNFSDKEIIKNFNKEKNFVYNKETATKLPNKEGLLDPLSYGEIVPSKCELNCDSPLIPYQYQKNFNIYKISNQENIGNMDNFCYSHSLMGIEENSSYMKIYPPPHILL